MKDIETQLSNITSGLADQIEIDSDNLSPDTAEFFEALKAEYLKLMDLVFLDHPAWIRAVESADGKLNMKDTLERKINTARSTRDSNRFYWTPVDGDPTWHFLSAKESKEAEDIVAEHGGMGTLPESCAAQIKHNPEISKVGYYLSLQLDTDCAAAMLFYKSILIFVRRVVFMRKIVAIHGLRKKDLREQLAIVTRALEKEIKIDSDNLPPVTVESFQNLKAEYLKLMDTVFVDPGFPWRIAIIASVALSVVLLIVGITLFCSLRNKN